MKDALPTLKALIEARIFTLDDVSVANMPSPRANTILSLPYSTLCPWQLCAALDSRELFLGGLRKAGLA